MWDSMREMKAGKTAELDGRAEDDLKSDGATAIEWLIWLLNIRFLTSVMPIKHSKIDLSSLIWHGLGPQSLNVWYTNYSIR